MFENIVRAAVLSVPLVPFDVAGNLSAMAVTCDKALREEPDIVLFGELALCGASCGSLLRQKKLQAACLAAAFKFAGLYARYATLFLVGLPLRVGEKTVSATAVIYGGEIRMFAASARTQSGLDALTEDTCVKVNGREIPVRVDPVLAVNGFTVALLPGLKPDDFPPAVQADVIAVPTALRADPVADLHTGTAYAHLSRQLRAGLIVSGTGMGESTYNGVFRSLGGIFEAGECLGFEYDYDAIGLMRDLDLDQLPGVNAAEAFSLGGENRERESLKRYIPQNPYLPGQNRDRVLDDIADTQIHALATRFKPDHLKKLVIGVSGGIDSTLALLVACAVCDRLGQPRTDIISVLMPGLGTKAQSRNLSEALALAAGTSVRKVDIKESVGVHFKDIAHDEKNLNATYENAQARERTQILFDIAGDQSGLVVGTGDLSEAALGWCTFGGDHISGYNVNASLTKALVTETSRRLARRLGGELPGIVEQIAAAPPSPELLPGDQVTQDIIGPYELHDFFLYYHLRYGMADEKIIALAGQAFAERYEPEAIRQVYGIFRKRFFTSQFKRNCAAEGALFGSVSLSPLRTHFPADLPTFNL